MTARERIRRSEQGAVFVQVGISLFVLMAFNVFVLDYGMMWIGRRQAQNAADAGALAGAVARGYDDFDDPPASDGVAAESAQNIAAANLVWQQAGAPIVTFDCPPGVTGRCVHVAVHRDGTNGSTTLPTLFGPILGITGQKVMASATSIVESGNATDCMRAIAFADDWLELRAPNNEFNYYDAAGNPLAGSRDNFIAPSATQVGRTIALPPPAGDLGERIIWESAWATTTPTTPITRQLVVPLRLPGPGTFLSKVENCSGNMVQLGQTLQVETSPIVAANDAFDNFLARDPDVEWNEGQHRIDNSCAPGCAPVSPRLIPVALYDPARFQLGRATGDWTQAGCPSSTIPCITVTNIVGFFVHGPFPPYGPHGHFLKYPGMKSSDVTVPTLVDDASWMVMTHLIR